MSTRVHTAATLGTAPPADRAPFLVVSLCADWCDTCRDFRQVFERLADGDPDGLYVWLDIEDDSALAGDIDVESFPTLAVFRGVDPVFWGVTVPQEGVVERMLEALRAGPGRVVVPPEVARLVRTLRQQAA